MIVNTAQAIQASSQTSAQQDLGSKDIFLKILIAQMQNQDPLKPQDAAQMSTQLAQFNMVEQQISTNRLLSTILSQSSRSTDSEMAMAPSYLGHTVSARTREVTFDGTSPIRLSLEMAQDVAKEIRIVDEAGYTVRTIPLDPATNKLVWDGTTDSGSIATSGNYGIEIVTTDANGNPVAGNAIITDQATAVRLTADGVFIMVGATPVSMVNITEIQ